MPALTFKKTDLASFRFNNRLWQSLLLLLAVYQFGSGTVIYTKATLAQYLISTAWHDSLQQDTPIKPWSWADTWPVARLKIGAEDLYVLEGASGRVLAFGPGHMSQTPMPGSAGNSVIVGHRDTHFASLQRLGYDDLIEVETFQGTSQYKIVGLYIVEQSHTELLNGSPLDMLTLITCYPFNSLQPRPTLRYVVRAIRL
jgi:sortase A